MLTVIIPYQGNKPALAQLLVSLQPQLHPDDDIYVIDESSERSAVELVKRYGSTRCYIFVEPTEKRGSEAIMFGLQSMKENKQGGALIMPEGAVIPTTFIANLKKVIKQGFDYIVFDEHYVEEMDPDFKWYTPSPQVKKYEQQTSLWPAVLYMASRMVENGEINSMYDANIALIESENIPILD